MTDSNRLRISLAREAVLGVATPPIARMRKGRITGESLRFTPTFVTSDEIRADRMNADPVKVSETNGGTVNFELYYPASRSFMSELFASTMLSDWVLGPEWDNTEIASSIGAVAATTIAVVNQSGLTNGFAGTAVKAGHIIKMSGFAGATNNSLARISASTATQLTTSGLTVEATPPATARIKVVGFEGTAADITATTTGLASTALNFTTLGLVVGQWIKIGGTGAAFQFATGANNGWARITAIAAGALTLDNRPTGWAVDAGTGKTIRVFTGDVVKNGTTLIPATMERSFLGQAVPTHILQKGTCANGMRLDFASERQVTGSFDLICMSGSQGTVANATEYAEAPTGTAMSSNVSVGRVAEAGASVIGPNWANSASLSVSNNLRTKTALGTVGAVDIGMGECAVSVTLGTYFGDNTLYAKFLAGTPTSVNLRLAQNGQGVVFEVPRLTYTDGAPSAGAKNQDVMLPLQGNASFDPTTSAHIVINRLEYFE